MCTYMYMYVHTCTCIYIHVLVFEDAHNQCAHTLYLHILVGVYFNVQDFATNHIKKAMKIGPLDNLLLFQFIIRSSVAFYLYDGDVCPVSADGLQVSRA